MAWDSADHLLAVANNADTPPFVTVINTDTRKIVTKIVFDGTNGTPDATQTGIEQSQWSPQDGHVLRLGAADHSEPMRRKAVFQSLIHRRCR